MNKTEIEVVIFNGLGGRQFVRQSVIEYPCQTLNQLGMKIGYYHYKGSKYSCRHMVDYRTGFSILNKKTKTELLTFFEENKEWLCKRIINMIENGKYKILVDKTDILKNEGK